MDRQEIESYAKGVKLPGGIEGAVSVREFHVEDSSTTHLAVECTTKVPESITFVPKLYCRDAAFKKMVVLELQAGGFERDFSNYEFESVKVDRKFAIQAAPDQDENWLRQLFSPVFLDWLGENAPEDFQFALDEGVLRGALEHEPKSTGDIDKLAALTAHVAEHIRKESLEDAPVTEATGMLAPPQTTEEREHVEKMVAKVDWSEPPADMMAAAKAYKGIAGRERGAWMPAITLGGGVFLFTLLVLFPFSWLFSNSAGFDGIDKLLNIIYAAVAVLIGGFLFLAVRQRQVFKRAGEYGKLAFVQQYAAKRDLEQEDASAFQRNFIRLKMPGPARFVMHGHLDGASGEGRLVVGADESGKPGVGGYTAAVLDAKGADDGPVKVDDADGLNAYVSDKHLVVSRPVPWDKLASIDGLDALAKRAGEIAKKL